MGRPPSNGGPAFRFTASEVFLRFFLSVRFVSYCEWCVCDACSMFELEIFLGQFNSSIYWLDWFSFLEIVFSDSRACFVRFFFINLLCIGFPWSILIVFFWTDWFLFCFLVCFFSPIYYSTGNCVFPLLNYDALFPNYYFCKWFGLIA